MTLRRHLDLLFSCRTLYCRKFCSFGFFEVGLFFVAPTLAALTVVVRETFYATIHFYIAFISGGEGHRRDAHSRRRAHVPDQVERLGRSGPRHGRPGQLEVSSGRHPVLRGAALLAHDERRRRLLKIFSGPGNPQFRKDLLKQFLVFFFYSGPKPKTKSFC